MRNFRNFSLSFRNFQNHNFLLTGPCKKVSICMTVLLSRFKLINVATYDCFALLLLNWVIYQSLSSFSLWNYEASIIQYSAWFFSFIKKDNINREKKRRPDLLKDWKIYKHKAFNARGNRRHFHSCVFMRTIRLDFVKKFKQPLDGQVAALIFWDNLAWLFS